MSRSPLQSPLEGPRMGGGFSAARGAGSAAFGEELSAAPLGAAAGGGWLEASPLVHGALLAVSFGIFAWQIALPSGVIGGAVGALCGAIAAERLIRARFRLPVIAGLAATVLLVGMISARILVQSTFSASILGSTASLGASDAFEWGGVLFAIATVLRALAIRYRAALAIEGAVVVLAVATTVAAHRDGMIARPLEVADWFWTQGLDPVIAFLGVGLIGAALFASVLAYRRSWGRTTVQLLLVLLLGGILASQIHSRDTHARKDVTGAASKKDDERSRGGGAGSKDAQNKEQQGQTAGHEGDGMPRGGSSGGKQRPAAVVVFHKEVAPSGGVFYFRHAVFSQFNGTRLVGATRSDVDTDALHDFVSQKRVYPSASRPPKGRELVATDVALLENHTRMFVLVDPTEVEPLANPDPARFIRAYRAVSAVLSDPYERLIGEEAGDPEWSDEVWRHYTELPKDERYHRLAAELQAGLKKEYQSDPIARAMIVKSYLEKTVTYSFAKNYDGEADPTAAFLFGEDKRGYCVHNAHAATYLLRAMGVPARVSAGYAVPAQNLGEGSSLLIKSGDAHAWAEIYLATIGWVPIEVTPEKSDVQPQQFQEKDLQQLLGEMARKTGRTSDQVATTSELMKALKALLAAIPYALLALVALAYLTKLWRLAAPQVLGVSKAPRIAYRAALDRLSAVGLSRRGGESREGFAGRVAVLSPSFSPLTEVHLAAALGSPRFARGGLGAGPSEAAPLPGLASRVGREVRKSLPWWRWVLGALNPVSWLWSR
jgi:transglutaminase-like putative cysteine protease